LNCEFLGGPTTTGTKARWASRYEGARTMRRKVGDGRIRQADQKTTLSHGDGLSRGALPFAKGVFEGF
jgi:hypothetical protein